MTKFDHRVNLPQIFAENNLAILPITRGDYVISTFSAYKAFEPLSDCVQKISIPPYLQSLIPQFIVSEAIALNCADACGILSDFLEDEYLVPTVSGRMSSGVFQFGIDTQDSFRIVSVNNSQLEIDAAYEGVKTFSLIEAKRDISDDFLVRQLYYPFRLWNDRVTKTVKPVFMVFSNGTFHFYQYQFDNPLYYNSLRLVKQMNYTIASGISMADVEMLLHHTIIVEEPSVPFPQADDMHRVVNLVELLFDHPMTKQDITAEYAFDERQTNYYADAGRYLDLIEKENCADGNVVFSLSERGTRIMQRDYKSRMLAIAVQILCHKAFHETFSRYLRRGEMPAREEIVQIMRQSNLYHVESDSTFYRRAFTVAGWVKWILSIIDEE